ncbi:MAG: type II secretion system F family protein [Chloroflexia bacterium]
MLPLLIALLLGSLVLVVAYEWAPLRRERAAMQLQAISGPQGESLPLLEAVIVFLAGAIERYLPAARIRRMDARLYWAHFLGRFRGWSGGMIVTAQFLGLALGGVLYILTRSLPIALLVGFVGYLLPEARLSGSTERIIRGIRKGLPDLAERLALAVVGGSTVDKALRSVTETYPGVLGEYLRAARNEADGRGVPLLTVLVDRSQASGMRELHALFLRLREIERQGVDAQARLLGLAHDAEREYLGFVQERVRSLGGKVVLPLIVFFLVPYLVLALAPLGFNVLQLLFLRR